VTPALSTVEADDHARRIAESLLGGERKAVLIGNLAAHHPQRAQLHALADLIATQTGARLGFLGDGANSVGGHLARAVPDPDSGLDARRALEQPRHAYLLLHAEAELDSGAARVAGAAMNATEFVVALTSYRHRALDYAQVLLPVSPFTETAGTFANIEGRLQGFNGVVRPLAETRPAWKVLRVLGNLSRVPGFDYETIEDVRREMLEAIGDVASRLGNAATAAIEPPVDRAPSVPERIGEVPIYHGDAVVRRASSLQATRDAQVAIAWMPGRLIDSIGLKPGDRVRVSQDGGEAVLAFGRDDRLPDNTVRVAAGCRETAGLGALFGGVSVERVPAVDRVSA
jgi:NADH-quinone oxidoreductase subunit G